MKNIANKNVPGNGQNQLSADELAVQSSMEQLQKRQADNNSTPIGRILLLAMLVAGSLGYGLWSRSGNNASAQVTAANSAQHAALIPESAPVVTPVGAATGTKRSNKPVPSAGVINSTTITGAGYAAPEVKTKGWVYESEDTEEGQSIIHFATVTSNEAIKLHGTIGSPAVLSVRERDGLNEVYLQIEKGAFLFNDHQATIRVGFDDEEPQPVACVSSEDSDPTLLFINSTAQFITSLKTASVLTIDADISHNGTQRLTFDVHNLKWNY